MNTKATLAALMIATALSHAVRAKEAASKQENIGVGSGLLVGALAGGPFGAIAGAAAGAWLGDRYSKSEKQRAQLESEIKVQAAVSDRYEHLVSGLHRLESDVPFKTNEAVLSLTTTEHLRALGTVLAGLPQAKVRVTGFADPRGSDSQNLALSQRRADAVVAVLSQAGVRTDQITVDARGAGDAPADAVTLDDFALERRATVRLEPASDELLSAQR